MSQLFATKSIHALQAASETGDHSFKRTLGPWGLAALGIGAIIGTGIFVLTGVAAADNAGPALALSFVVAGVICAFAALCYAELAAMIPVSGSAYSYTYATLGEFMAWFIGWNLVLEYLVAISAIAVGWSGYFVQMTNHIFDWVGLNWHVPAALVNSPLVKGSGVWEVLTTGAVINLPAVFIVMAMTTLCYVGISQSSLVNNIIVVVKLLVIFLFIGFGLFYITPANWHPFVPERIVDSSGIGHFGWFGIIEGASIIFFAYIGFDAATTVAQEAKNPQRDMPIGILVALAICTVLYIAVALVLTGMMPYLSFKGVANPVGMAVESIPALKNWLGPLIAIGALAGLSSALLTAIIAQPRIFYSMAKDGLMPSVFAKVHPKHRTPHIGTLITGLVASVLAGFLPIDILAELCNIGTLLAFMTVCIAVLVLRYTRPDLPRPFKTPLPWVTCTLGTLGCLYLMYGLPLDTWLRLLVWTAIGMAIYFGYGYRYSKLREIIFN